MGTQFMARSGIRYERLGTDVRFTIYESKPDFVEDNEWSVDISPESAQNLPARTTANDVFWLPEAALWIGFYWTSHMERGAGVNVHDDVCHGPFRIQADPPSSEAVQQALQEGRLVELK
jgi:hypothetical protein